ncbi:MAG TPA: tripartite tricarboxylate transporter substrate binding protein [Xanthobacteraceae bacterium]|nr:tripartite tricarboxylate transporter substrate binding protein [Xanthobacteraceae bacterium]
MLQRIAMAALAVLSLALPASAQTYPTKPVHLIVAYAPGGTGDVVARVIADKLAGALGQSVVVENRAGASGAIGATSVANAVPDGHTLLVGQTGEIVVNQYWMKGLTYDPKSLMPVALATVVPLALTVPGKTPYATMAEMFKAMQTSGKPFSFASAGTGTPGHFAGEYLSAKMPGKLTHVPYKGAGPALNDIIGGHVDMYFPGFPPVMPMMKAGTVKVLAVSSAQRSEAAPDIPTVAEATGFSDFDFTLWQGFFAPRGTPADVIAKLNGEINKILRDAEVRKKLVEAGANVMPQTTEQFAAFVQAESTKYERIIRETGVKPE